MLVGTQLMPDGTVKVTIPSLGLVTWAQNNTKDINEAVDEAIKCLDIAYKFE